MNARKKKILQIAIYEEEINMAPGENCRSVSLK